MSNILDIRTQSTMKSVQYNGLQDPGGYGQSVLWIVGVCTIRKGYAQSISLTYEVYIPEKQFCASLLLHKKFG